VETNESTEINVTVVVIDVNDEPPQFNQDQYRVGIPEDLSTHSYSDILSSYIFAFEIRSYDLSEFFSILPRFFQNFEDICLILSVIIYYID